MLCCRFDEGCVRLPEASMEDEKHLAFICSGERE